MKFLVKIDLDNEAFASAPSEELSDILATLANRVKAGTFLGKTRLPLHDSNGNTVGEASVQ